MAVIVDKSTTARGVWLVDPATGEPASGGGGGGGGDASAANQTAVQTPIAPATATATKAVLIGAQYNSTLPTFTNGQQGAYQIDVNGRQFVNNESTLRALTGARQTAVATSTTSALADDTFTAGKGRYFWNDSGQVAYLLYDSAGTSNGTASATNATTPIAAGEVWFEGTYMGKVFAILASGTGNMRVTRIS